MQSDRWIEKGVFRSKTKSCILTQSKKRPFDPNFFDRAIRSGHPVEKSTFSTGRADRIARSKKFFKPTASRTTPQNTRPQPTTVAMLAGLLLLLLLQRGTSCSPTSSANRHSMAAVGVIDDLCVTPLLQQLAAAVLSLTTLVDVQRHNRDDEADEGSPRAKRTLCSRKRRDKDACLSTASS